MTDDLQHKALKVVLFSQLLLEAMDDVKGTKLYKSKIKQYGGTFINLMKHAYNQTGEVYNQDPETATNLFRELDELVSKLANQDIRDLVMINQIHSHYSDHKEDWQNYFSLELQKLDDNEK